MLQQSLMMHKTCSLGVWRRCSLLGSVWFGARLLLCARNVVASQCAGKHVLPVAPPGLRAIAEGLIVSII
jgi:hypothetical protein